DRRSRRPFFGPVQPFLRPFGTGHGLETHIATAPCPGESEVAYRAIGNPQKMENPPKKNDQAVAHRAAIGSSHPRWASRHDGSPTQSLSQLRKTVAPQPTAARFAIEVRSPAPQGAGM